MYYSAYDEAFLDAWHTPARLRDSATDVWCIFDNTTLGAATPNALALQERLSTEASGRSGVIPSEARDLL